MSLIINGWNYLTEINPKNLPTEQKIQKNYLNEYNNAYNIFLKELCLTETELDNIKKKDTNETKYQYIFDLTDQSDIITNNNNYPIKFLKSKFLNYKIRKIRQDLINYYKPLGFYIKGPFELINNKNLLKYYIELYWQSLN